jgi:DNA polymerase-3 subunit gamma/tau
MRDGLSLLDQAIAYGGGQVNEAEVRAMLGTIDQNFIENILQGLAAGDVGGLLKAVSDATEYGLDYEAILKDLLLSLHRIALAQADPALAGEEGEHVLAHASAMSPQDVQLYYQIGVMGQRDLPFAPDPRSGLEMVLLRMVAFRPAEVGEVRTSVPATAPAPKTVTPTAVKPQTTAPATAATKPAAVISAQTPTSPSPGASGAKWNEVVAQLGLTGLLRELANNTMLESHADGVVSLTLEESHAKILNKEREEDLRKALEKYHGTPIRLKMNQGRPSAETPAKEKNRLQDERQQAAVQAIVEDPNVRALQEKFGARVNPASIRPKV